MATRRIISPRSSLGLPFRAIISRSYSSSSAAHHTVPLAFDHHVPPKGGHDHKDSPIIFMHGLFGSKKNNRSVSKVLARDLKRHVYTVDLRNHGETPHAPRHDYLAMADDVAGFISDHNLRDPTLIGHSMGAKTAMALSLKEPSLIRDIVSVDNAPVDAILATSFARYIQGMRRIEEAGVTRQAEADKILQEYEPDLAIRQFLLGNLSRPPAEDGTASPTLKFRVPLDVLARSLGHLGDFPFKDPSERRFEKPALFVRGSRSTYVPDEVVPLIGQFFPRFTMVDIDAGHWVISEKPEEFLRAVIEFLSPKE
ncbi:alpha/beta-hydrolase [Daldinia vernicosa]|uniref:alpha/beta-hydrolase n=1 Tax=Daldinia vernicosa TaxID=114800 RepID=UPI0020080D25|nr:alpha/beta-hydrolase [Daldinia vernicosa]KAI0852281.1 alpha/beta-hydrolase [Daldinia vernicosa]